MTSTHTDPTVDVEPIARALVHAWMEHLGYTPEQIAESDRPRPHNRGGQDHDLGYVCEVTEQGWQCYDGNGEPAHPVHDEADSVAEFAMFILEHPALAGRLLPDGGEPDRTYTQYRYGGWEGLDEGWARALKREGKDVERRTVTEYGTPWESLP